MSYVISFALLIVLIIEQQSPKEWQTDLIYAKSFIINNVALVLKSHFHILITSFYLMDNRVLHTLIAILYALYMFYVTDMTDIDFSFNLP